MPYQELPGIGMQGLNTDTPAQALDQAYFSEGNNMRPFDGSLQTVYAFGGNEDDIAPVDGNNPEASRIDVYALSGWIETGANELRLAYLWRQGAVYNLQIINDLTGPGNDEAGANAPTMLESNDRWGEQLLAFNGIMLVNDSINQPIFVFDSSTTDTPNYLARFVAGWLSSPVDNISFTDDEIATLNSGGTVTLTQAYIDELDDPGVLVAGTAYTRTDIEQFAQANSATRVTCERLLAYNNRLIALNLEGDYLGDNLGNASIVWSTPIDELGSLNNVTFRFTSTNSAGDDILTETPGEVVDGGVLGEYLIIYKDDAVYRYQDVGDPLFLVGQVQFSDDGIYSPDCFADIGGGRHLVLGNYGVYIHQGGPERQNISRNRVQDVLYSDINTTAAQKDKTFLFHHENDKEVWICIPTTSTGDCDKAYVYNYEYDTWHTRTIPDIRGISTFQKDGELWILGFGSMGIFRLGDERRGDSKFLEGNIEVHYLAFGDNSKVKHLSAVYPHAMGKVILDIDTSNNVGSFDEFPITDDFPKTQTFDGSTNQYKLDYREHGRFYHIQVKSSALTADDIPSPNPDNLEVDDPINPMMTGMGFQMKIGGDR